MSLILSAFADEHSMMLEDQCRALNSFGIEYLEMRGVDGKNVSLLTEDEVAAAKATLEKYGIKISSIGSPIGKVKLDADLDEHLTLAKRVFATAKALGAKYVRIFSFYPPEGASPDWREKYRGKVHSELSRLIEAADPLGIVLCHENEALIYGESPEDCLDLVSSFRGKLRCVFDMGNFVLDGHEPLPAYALLREYIEYFHIKDALFAGAIVPAGKGEARIKEILDTYKSTGGKDTFVTLEPHLETFSGLNALVGKKFENPYKYGTPEEAFADAVRCVRSFL